MVSARQRGAPCSADTFQGLGFRAAWGPGWADTFTAGRGILMSRTHCSLLFLSLVSRAPSAETLLLLSQQFRPSTTVPVSLLPNLALCWSPKSSLAGKSKMKHQERFYTAEVFALRASKGKGFSICFVSPLAQYVYIGITSSMSSKPSS